MRVDDFIADLPTLWDGDPQDADAPVDRRFRAVIETVEGMASENTLALLNLAAAHLADGEVYAEVGTWKGCTITGASLGRAGRFVAVDDFSEFGGPRIEAVANLNACGATLIEGDFRDVLARIGSPIGVYFYDGAHNFSDQYDALRVAEPLLANEAVVVIDDTVLRGVTAANRLYTERRPQYELIARFDPTRRACPRWWNGIEVYAFRRALGPGQGPRKAGYAWTRLRMAHPIVRARRVLSSRR